jgi:hypothetical protein
VLRWSAIEFMGVGIGSIPLDRLLRCIGALHQAIVPAGLKIATRAVLLSEVEQAWHSDDNTRRTAFTLDVHKS